MPRYTIVPERSRLWIDARSNVHPIHSSMVGLEGYVELDVGTGGMVAGSPSASLSFPVARLKSGNVFEDRELQKRIDARRHPRIEGKLTKIEPLEGEHHYRVTGDLTFRGITKSVADEMTISVVDDHSIKLEGESTFDIRDFGMEPPRILVLRVEPDVKVRVEIVASTE